MRKIPNQDILDDVLNILEIQKNAPLILFDKEIDQYTENPKGINQEPEVVIYKPRYKKQNKTCKDCSCGKAAREKSQSSQKCGVVDLEDIFESKCGNCWKGDEYRCSSCPELGKPPRDIK